MDNEAALKIERSKKKLSILESKEKNIKLKILTSLRKMKKKLSILESKENVSKVQTLQSYDAPSQNQK